MNHSRTGTLQLLYVSAVTCVGAAVVAESLARLWQRPPGPEWLLLAGLTLLTGSFTVKLPTLSAKISVSETFVFTSVLLFGPAGGTITVVLDALVISLWMKRGKRSVARVLFNATAPAIALRVASETFFWMSDATPGQISRHDIGPLTIPIFAFALLYFLVNTALVAGALGLERHESPIRIWWKHFPQVSITYFVGSSIAMLVVAYTERIDGTIVGIILPLLVISYLTFKTSMGRLEDANRHVDQVNILYLETIETLAMAVDAKDQVTHGHIRRVQVYALELAKRLGVADTHQLKAVEAAALLHDMGKLAIPEYILNKPGKLTTAEFSKMKRHADIGADLLSSIRFPYPVVPIVRHHHENWDGTGYPTGLAGTDIPLGARILSVVDCFDALTSDRPYRPALSDGDAFAILIQRRGNMYDPLVVDTFIAVHSEIAGAARIAGEQARSLTTSLSTESGGGTLLKDIQANAAHEAALAEYDRQLESAANLPDAALITFDQVRALMPATVLVMYRYVAANDTLQCIASAGDPNQHLRDFAIPNGERITGWAVANDRTIANSQATLDLNDKIEIVRPALRSAIATPVKSGTRILGAVTIYSQADEPYTDDHRYTLERIASLIADRPDLLSPRETQDKEPRVA